MAVSLILRDVDKSRRGRVVRRYEPTFSSTYATNGATLDLTKATGDGPHPGKSETPISWFIENPAGGDERPTRNSPQRDK